MTLTEGLMREISLRVLNVQFMPEKLLIIENVRTFFPPAAYNVGICIIFFMFTSFDMMNGG